MTKMTTLLLLICVPLSLLGGWYLGVRHAEAEFNARFAGFQAKMAERGIENVLLGSEKEGDAYCLIAIKRNGETETECILP